MTFEEMSPLQRRLHNAALVIEAEGDDHGFAKLQRDAIEALQPNTQEPVAYVSRIAANGRADISWLQGVSVGDKLFTHPAPQQPAEVAALQAKVNAAEARERQTRATLHKYMANQQQAEPVSHEL